MPLGEWKQMPDSLLHCINEFIDTPMEVYGSGIPALLQSS